LYILKDYIANFQCCEKLIVTTLPFSGPLCPGRHVSDDCVGTGEAQDIQERVPKLPP